MIEISSSVEKKDPAAAGSFFFWKNVYFVSTKTNILPIICLAISYFYYIIMMLGSKAPGFVA